MRIAFMGTPDFAVPTLNRLVADRHEIAAVYTQPPRRAGRGKALTRGAVQRRAEELNLPVISPTTLRDNGEQRAFRELDLDAAVVAAYGLILPEQILQAPRLGCLNVHGSLLPRWRGAAPVQRAILAGDEWTGVTIMDMERGLDTGPMRLARAVRVDGKTSGELSAEIAAMGADAMASVLANPERYPSIEQPAEGSTYAAKIEKHEARLDFANPAARVERQIRAFAPTPGAFFEFDGERIRVLSAVAVAERGSPGTVLDDHLTIACEDGAVRPMRVQRGGRAVMDAAELLRGLRLPPGTQLS